MSSESKLPRFITFTQLRAEYGIARASAYRLIEAEGMPRPYQMGPNSVRFNLVELEEWFANRPHADVHVNKAAVG